MPRPRSVTLLIIVYVCAFGVTLSLPCALSAQKKKKADDIRPLEEATPEVMKEDLKFFSTGGGCGPDGPQPKFVKPGDYTVTLTMGKKKLTQKVKVTVIEGMTVKE